MIKKILFISALVVLVSGLVFGAVIRTQAKTGNEGLAEGTVLGSARYASAEGGLSTNTQVDGFYGQGQGNGGSGQGGRQGVGGQGSGEMESLLPAVPGDLSEEETAALLYMREEEKLAHDVYVTLYAQWGVQSLQNISESELAHTESVKTLIDRYGLADPALGELGVFSNQDLQALFNDLVERGSGSLVEALKVGAAIEEIDILDLQERLSQTDKADIQQVFNNLLQGSYNHLRAFVNTLNNQAGETYQPQYLSVEAFQAIMGASSGNGGGAGNGQGGNGGAGGGYRGGRP
jgi:hypothetical protein